MAEQAQQLSVVIAAHNGRAEVENCLASLQTQELPASSPVAVEIIVAGNFCNETAAQLKQSYPDVRLLRADQAVSVPELRSWGAREAKGDIVALLEDHCAPAPGWYRAILSGHALNRQVVGGAIENASTRRFVDWAVYLFEYSAYMNPVPRGAVQQLPGNNVCYSRSALQLLESLLKQNVWETMWHRQLSTSKIELVSSPDMVVFHRKSFSVKQFWHLARLQGHNYAAARTFESAGEKWLWTIGVVGLPGLMLLRIGRRVFHKGRHLKEYLLVMPLLFWFSLAWALGEITGTVTRRPVAEKGWGNGQL